MKNLIFKSIILYMLLVLITYTFVSPLDFTGTHTILYNFTEDIPLDDVSKCNSYCNDKALHVEVKEFPSLLTNTKFKAKSLLF